MHSSRHPSPAMVIALIALFVSLGGTAAALSGSNTVQSNDIGPGQQVGNADTKPVEGDLGGQRFDRAG